MRSIFWFIFIKKRSLVLCCFLTNLCFSQIHRDSLFLTQLWDWTNIKPKLKSTYIPFGLDFYPEYSQEFGNQKWYFVANRVNSYAQKPAPDFQFSLTVYDSATIVKIVETDEKTINFQIGHLYFEFPDSSEEYISQFIKWKKDSIVFRNDPKFNLFLSKFEESSTALIQNQTVWGQGISYTIYSSSKFGTNFISFNLGSKNKKGQSLYLWVDEQYDVLRKYIENKREMNKQYKRTR